MVGPPLSTAPTRRLTCIAARAEQRHTRGRQDNVRCRLIIGLEARSTAVDNERVQNGTARAKNKTVHPLTNCHGQAFKSTPINNQPTGAAHRRLVLSVAYGI